ncbi:MAG: GOLPH3/VPS74 family protein, partial [Planctomycetota bacterium]
MTTVDNLFLHEQIMLLALRDREGTIEFGVEYRHALGGAILAELLLGRRLTVDDVGKKKVARMVSDEPTGDGVIDECLAMVADSKPRQLEDWVTRFADLKDLKHRVAQQLCRRGILRADEQSVLLLFTRRIYPEVDHGPEQALIERLRAAIFEDGVEVDPLTTVLVSVANGAGLLRFTFDKKQLRDREDRIEQIVNGELSGQATKDAVAA